MAKRAASLDEVVEVRLAELLDWLRENAPEIRDEQKHLDAESAERAYFHFGYATALEDIVKHEAFHALLPQDTGRDD